MRTGGVGDGRKKGWVGSDLGGLGQMGLKFRSEFGSNGCRGELELWLW